MRFSNSIAQNPKAFNTQEGIPHPMTLGLTGVIGMVALPTLLGPLKSSPTTRSYFKKESDLPGRCANMSNEKEKSRDKLKVHKLSLKGTFHFQGVVRSNREQGSSKLIAEFVRWWNSRINGKLTQQ